MTTTTNQFRRYTAVILLIGEIFLSFFLIAVEHVWSVPLATAYLVYLTSGIPLLLIGILCYLRPSLAYTAILGIIAFIAPYAVVPVVPNLPTVGVNLALIALLVGTVRFYRANLYALLQSDE